MLCSFLTQKAIGKVQKYIFNINTPSLLQILNLQYVLLVRFKLNGEARLKVTPKLRWIVKLLFGKAAKLVPLLKGKKNHSTKTAGGSLEMQRLCEILPNQVVMKKLDKNQTRIMIREAAKPPAERKRRIMAAIKDAKINQDPNVEEFGLKVSDEFQKVTARVLDPPTLEYGNRQVFVRDGKWEAERFLNPVSLNKWAIVSASPYFGMEDLKETVNSLVKMGRDKGMEIAQPLKCDALCEPRSKHMDAYSLESSLYNYFKTCKANQTQIVVVVFPKQPHEAYGIVKFVAELKVGILTQCINEMTKMNGSTIKNILLKINAKLNGVNHSILGNKCPVSVRDVLNGAMLMGADVTHPSPEQKTIPSVAAVTASHDNLAFKYNMCWRLQPPQKEIIVDIRAMVRRQLLVYQAMNGNVGPKKIIFFRDGVSEGQFSQVLNAEMTAIKMACLDVLKVELPVTFLVVQKRHHIRFFPNSRDADQKGNVPAGTVVDTDITHPRELDFYLVSHASLQGTSRPTKYHRLWDDNDISEDDLEELTFYLCHLYSRCTRSVSYPAPTYYAHLAAARGRVYLERSSINLDELREEMAKRNVKHEVMDCSPMFFT